MSMSRHKIQKTGLVEKYTANGYRKYYMRDSDIDTVFQIHIN